LKWRYELFFFFFIKKKKKPRLLVVFSKSFEQQGESIELNEASQPTHWCRCKSNSKSKDVIRAKIFVQRINKELGRVRVFSLSLVLADKSPLASGRESEHRLSLILSDTQLLLLIVHRLISETVTQSSYATKLPKEPCIAR